MVGGFCAFDEDPCLTQEYIVSMRKLSLVEVDGEIRNSYFSKPRELPVARKLPERERQARFVLLSRADMGERIGDAHIECTIGGPEL